MRFLHEIAGSGGKNNHQNFAKKIGQSGSHVQFKNEKGAIITVSVHPGRPIGRGLLRKIIRDLEVSREEFIELVKKA